LIFCLEGLLHECGGTSRRLALGNFDSSVDDSRSNIRALKKLLKIWDCCIGYAYSLLYWLWDRETTTDELECVNLSTQSTDLIACE
jgi:hypothetical protein